MTYNAHNYTHEPLAAVIDALETGAEVLREFDQWIESGGLQTFGEWLIKAVVPEEEQPRVIITPPPKKETNKEYLDRMKKDPRSSVYPRPTYNAYAHASKAMEALREYLKPYVLPGTTIWKDLANDQMKMRCHFCNAVLTINAHDYKLMDAHFRSIVGAWYAYHGPNCGRVNIVHNGKENV